VQPIASGLTTASFTDSTVASGTLYYYTITAVNAAGQSSASIELAAMSQSALGKGDGLLGSYYNNATLTGTPIQRIDATVNFSWGTGSPMKGINTDFFSVAWTGTLVPTTGGSYTFYTNSDDGVRLYINGQLVINDWTAHSAKQDTSAAISLAAGEPYAIRMEYFENTGSATAQLSWSSPQVTKAIIPKTALFSGQATVPVSPVSQMVVSNAVRMAVPATVTTSSSSTTSTTVKTTSTATSKTSSTPSAVVLAPSNASLADLAISTLSKTSLTSKTAAPSVTDEALDAFFAK
jgi:PA14 domain